MGAREDETPVPTAPMPGEGSAATSPDEAIAELTGAAAPQEAPAAEKAAPHVHAVDYATPVPPPANDNLFRAGTLVYTSAGITVLFFWLLFGDFAFSMRDRSVGPTVQLFLKSLNASNFTMTLLVASLPTAISMVLAPMVSYRSDRLRSRWGRRIPFLLIPTPFAALAMVAIAFSTQLGAMLLKVVPPAVDAITSVVPALTTSLAGVRAMTPTGATLVVFGIAWTIFEVAIITSGAVIGGLINDVVPRGRLGRFYGLFRSISLADAIIFNFFLIKFAETHFELMFTLIAIVFGVGFTVMCFKVREGEYPPPEVRADDARSRGFFGALKVYFRECYSLPYYRWCFAAFTLGTLSFEPVNLYSIYYAKQLNMDIGFYGQMNGSGYIVSLTTAYLLGSLVDRYHALRIGMIAMGFYAFSAVYGMLFIRDSTTFAVALVAHTILSGAYFTASASLMSALLPRAKFAQFASAAGIVTAASKMVIQPSLGKLLDLTNSNYRLTFAAGLILSLSAIAAMAIVLRKMRAHGGTKHYVAPGDTMAPLAAGAAAPRGGH